jgi:RpiR family transcriptional regulator, carbohydrate utilization regulator
MYILPCRGFIGGCELVPWRIFTLLLADHLMYNENNTCKYIENIEDGALMPVNISERSLGRISHKLLVRMQAIYDNLKSAERKAADLLLDQPDFFAGASIVEAGEIAGCSEATLVRLARKLGYGGYPELKAALLSDRDQNPVKLYEGISEQDECSMIVSKVFQASIQALNDTLGVLDFDEYGKAVEAFCNAGKILFCGVGDAMAVAQSGYQKFMRIGMNVQVSADLDVQLIAASHLEKNDVVVAISHSGKTRTIVDLVKFARTRGATVISITNYPVSPLAKNSDIRLLTAAFANHVKGEVMSKRITELCILESLFINTLIKRKDVLADRLERSNRALEINKL